MTDDHQAKVGLKAFFNIAKAWGLSEDDEAAILGQPDREALCAWKDGKGPAAGKETVLRISYVLGIYKALHILLPVRKIADEWIRQPNTAPIFRGRSARDRMADGDIEDLKAVRQYLDAELYT